MLRCHTVDIIGLPVCYQVLVVRRELLVFGYFDKIRVPDYLSLPERHLHLVQSRIRIIQLEITVTEDELIVVGHNLQSHTAVRAAHNGYVHISAPFQRRQSVYRCGDTVGHTVENHVSVHGSGHIYSSSHRLRRSECHRLYLVLREIRSGKIKPDHRHRHVIAD